MKNSLEAFSRKVSPCVKNHLETSLKFWKTLRQEGDLAETPHKMDQRIPYNAKGKTIADDYSQPPRKRLRAPELDTSDLVQENALTLIRRLTNPEV